MGYEFGEVPVSKKKSGKLRNLAIAVLLFISIIAVRELAAANTSSETAGFSGTEKILLNNFSLSKAVVSTSPAKNYEIPPAEESPAENPSEIPEKTESPIFFAGNFFFENKSEAIAETPQSLDIGISKFLFENSTLSAQIKNYANSEINDELCLNVSSKRESAFLCSNFTVSPLSELQFNFPFPFSKDGYYNALLYLNRADDNSTNDNFSLQIKYGKIHDLAIENLTLVRDDENPLKINIKVRIVNNGDFNETALSLVATINNQTKEYGPYNYIIKSSRTFSYSRTFNQSIPVSATFSITNYSNFAEDADEENNIKSSSVHVG